MLRALFLAALGVAATVGTAPAGDDAVPLGRYQPKTGGITAGVPANSRPTPADADDDTELVHWRRGFYGGYRGFYGAGYYGGFNRSFYGFNSFNTFNSGFGFGYASFYRPGFAVSYYSAPRFYAPPVYFAPSFYYAPPVYTFPNYGFSYYGYFPIAGGSAPAVTLSLPARNGDAAPGQPLPAPAPRTDTFKYDGGPAKPLPAPQPEPAAPQRIEPAQDGTLSIKFTPKPAAKPVYRFKAFGEK